MLNAILDTIESHETSGRAVIGKFLSRTFAVGDHCSCPCTAHRRSAPRRSTRGERSTGGPE
jgi:hypothetical protein